MMDSNNELTLEEEVKAFFDSAPPLQNSDEISEKLKNFIDHNYFPSGKFILTTLNNSFWVNDHY